MKTVIIGDSCSDLPGDYVASSRIPVMQYSFSLQDKEYFDDFGVSLSYGEFYQRVREGEMPTTSQLNVHTIVAMFQKYVKEGIGVIFLSFSSALSNSYNNGILARKMVLEEYPEGDITVIDTLSASLGEGLLLRSAVEMQKNGAGKEEIVSWVEENKLKVNHWFTVEDLHHLKRGGRVSGAAAFVGSMLQIKPILHVDDLGRLIPVTKVRGRKKSIKNLADILQERIVEPEKQIIGISHGDCLEDANYLKEIIMDCTPVKDVIINFIGPVIGAHAGPGTLALFFFGQER
ncbi:DegV family protein [Dehalobacterium formicoaceticum]|uniref:DegV family protein n=1 Tax=Dehalobacterium formicoaceticum TaxID=51515 RepID=A0ABT1Y583_9FIRM|nr:DegV family protein [Dehalobacterium formicoaceticum]MCR6545079.1 DegV family protein [Dehalobacterium formicoaceticum]